MFNKLKADAYYPSVADIPVHLYRELDYELIVFDFDNTLSEHGASKASEYTLSMINRWREAGFEVYVISNAKLGRSEKIAEMLPVEFIGDARKPGTSAFEKIFEYSDVEKSEMLFCGDQIFTDVWAAKNFGIDAIVVDRLTSAEPYYVKLKRILEKVVKFFNRTWKHYDNLLD